MPSWPSTLPDCVLADGYDETPNSGVLFTSMDVGPDKTRLRTTATTRDLSVAVALTRDQLDIFEDFFGEQIAGGSLPFQVKHPRTGKVVSVLIIGQKPYRITELSARRWRVSMTFQIQP